MDRSHPAVRGRPSGDRVRRGALAAAGSWATLRALRDHAPPLAREIMRLDPQNQTTHYLMIITDAGVDFYEKHRRLYNAFYPP